MIPVDGSIVTRPPGAAAGAAPGQAHCRRNTTGTITLLAIGSAPRRAGTKRHWRTAPNAASSRRGNPLLCLISTFSALPPGETRTSSSTLPSSRKRRDSGGYAGAGFCRYAASNLASVTGKGAGAGGGAEGAASRSGGAGGCGGTTNGAGAG